MAELYEININGTDIRIGSKDKFVPNLNASFKCESSDERFFLNLNRKDLTVTDEQPISINDEVRFTIAGETHIWHQEGNKLKWDIEFSEKPPTNAFEWELQGSESLEFLYQDTLENDFLKNNLGLSLEDFLSQHERPDNVIGSYAVYCGRAGKYADVNFKSGKLCHIYRPLCIDADKKEVWAELQIKDGVLSITIPQDFLETAKYPITLDPNIGYTSEPASQWASEHRDCAYQHSDYTTAGANDGTATKMWVWSNGGNQQITYEIGYYSGSPTDLDESQQNTLDASESEGWKDTDLSDGTITGSARYFPALSWTYLYSTGRVAHYDTGNSGDGQWRVNGASLGLPDPYSGGSWGDHAYRVGLYLEYTESGGDIAISLDKLMADVTSKDLVVSPSGEAAISLDKLTANGIPKDLNVSPWTTTISLDKLLTEAAVKDLTVSLFGEASVSLGKLTAYTSIENLIVAPSGEIAIMLDKLAADILPKDLTLSLGTISILLDKLISEASPKDLIVSPSGEINISLNKLINTCFVKNLNLSLGTTTVNLDKLLTTALLNNLSLSLGEATILLDKLSTIGSIKDLSLSVGTLSILLDKLSALAFAKDISPFGTGEIDIGLDKLSAILSPKDLTLSVNENVVFLNTLPANLSPKSLNLSLGEAIILLDKLAAIGSVRNLSLSFGETGILLDRLSAIGSIKDVNLSFGEAIAILNKLSVLGSIKDISAIGTGEIGIALDKLSAQGSINDLIITAIAIVPLNKLSAVGSIKDLDLSFLGEATIPLNALSAICSVKEITAQGVVLEINIPFSFHSGLTKPKFHSGLTKPKFHSV